MASMPATRAAVTTCARAKCQKSPGYSLTGSKLPSTRACCDADRSPAPKMTASSRSPARRRPPGRGTRDRHRRSAPSHTCARGWRASPARTAAPGAHAPPSDDSFDTQGRTPVRVETQELAEHCVVVGPERAPEVRDPGRRLAHERQRSLDGDPTEVGVVELHERTPCPQMLVGHELLRVVHRCRGDI